ncbi:hypothetical protein NFC81_12760 [Salinispirillum sp. LH 10-3-1]|uniref:EF-hand domain-containing protein n=1 Tax=Salinispirillum sp. LH 10-3-1 TaxID=2952525 RepID=A0AB38YDZ2_9GAMM
MKKTLISTALLLVSATGFAATSGLEAQVEANVYEAFTSLDVAGEGFITLEEAQAHDELFAQFMDVDVNGDGVISLDEFNEFMTN